MTERPPRSGTSTCGQGSSVRALRQQRSNSLRGPPRGDGAATRAAVAGPRPTERSRRSLQGVIGERRGQLEEVNVGQRPARSSLEEKPTPDSSGNGLRRTQATTSLLRSVQRSPGRTCLVFVSNTSLVGAILVALFIGLIALQSVRSGDDKRRLQASEGTASARVTRCRSEACRRIDSLLKDAMDSRARPCDDFHAYVCGSWSRSHPGQTVAQALSWAFLSNVTRRARDIRVSFPNASRPQTAVQKAARHLIACDNIVAASEDQSEEVKKVLAKGGITWPDGFSESVSESHVLKAMFYMSRVVKIPVLLEISMEHGAKQRVVIRRPHSAAVLLQSLKGHVGGTALGKYEHYFRTVYDAFSMGVHSADVKARFRSILRLETALVSFLATSTKEHEKNDTWLANTANVHHITRGISKKHWLKAFQVFMAIPGERGLPVVLHNGIYFQRLFSLLDKLGEADFAELYFWLCVQALVPFSSGRIVAARHGGSKDLVLQTHRWHCFSTTDKVFHYALEHPYLSDVTNDEVREDFSNLIQRISESFAKVLQRTYSHTLANKCGAYSDESLTDTYAELFRHSRPEYFENIYAHYPDMTLSAITNWLRTVESSSAAAVNGDEPEGPGSTMDANYTRAWSKPLAASYLDVPWYSFHVPSAIKFAGIGSALFKRLISELSSNRRVCQKAVLEQSNDTVDCLATAHGDNIQNFEAIKTDARDSMLSWTVLWMAFRASLESRVNVTVLEHFPRLSQSALFFIVGCLLTCGEARDVAEARCNMPLRHDENFAEAFSCVWGSPMRPRNRCPRTFAALTETVL